MDVICHGLEALPTHHLPWAGFGYTTFTLTNLSYAQESAGRAGGWWVGVVGVRRAGVGSAERPVWATGGALGALEGCGRKRRAFLLILRLRRALCAAACVNMFFQTVLYTVVCVLCACGSGKNHLSAPLTP